MEEEIKRLKEENEQLKQRLKKYTNPPAYKKYYEANKDEINKKKRERARIAYQKKKEQNAAKNLVD